jgi:xanthine dehydrogenase YagS FAD-binding subunit
VTAPELRAGGTDLAERRRSGVSRGPVLDVLPTPGMAGITADDRGAVRIGALTRIAELADDPRLARHHAAVASAAAALATPQIRQVATLGGNLAQRSRCWYYRNPHTACLKKGDSVCPARTGNHLYGVAFDLGPCVAPHPSTLAAALLAHDAAITTSQRERLTVPELLGDGSTGDVDNRLGPGEVILHVDLPAPIPGERGFYRRATSRLRAEWPLVELVARVTVADGAFGDLRLVAGGVAPTPLRLLAAEAAGRGAAVNAATIAAIADHAVAAARPLPMTGYKLDLLRALVRELIERALP